MTKHNRKTCPECQFETSADYSRTMGHSSHSQECSKRDVVSAPTVEVGWMMKVRDYWYSLNDLQTSYLPENKRCELEKLIRNELSNARADERKKVLEKYLAISERCQIEALILDESEIPEKVEEESFVIGVAYGVQTAIGALESRLQAELKAITESR